MAARVIREDRGHGSNEFTSTLDLRTPSHEFRSPGPSAPGQPPRLPERYELLRHIASGGMASVWCAEDRLLDRTVAIKILAERFAHDQLAVLRFKREARAAARVADHPHVVTVYDVGDLEPAEGERGRGQASLPGHGVSGGGTVADAIRVGAVRRQEALRWITEAAAALDHAHASGIVHRDIKPANFLLDRKRTLHVADFGIARLVSEDTITSTDQLFGTAAYLSPEQALGQEATSASDRYALAVTAFELLTGERPFTAPPTSPPMPASTSRISRRRRARATAASRPRSTRCWRAGMAKDPAARFATAGAFVEALRGSLASSPRPRAAGPTALAPRPRPTLPRTRALGERRTAPTAGGWSRLSALTAAVLGIAAVGLATLGGGSHPVSSTTADGTRHAQVATRTSASRRRRAQPAGTVKLPARGRPRPPTPAQLQATGHQEMLDGDYQSAIPTLRQAVSAAPPEQRDL